MQNWIKSHQDKFACQLIEIRSLSEVDVLIHGMLIRWSKGIGMKIEIGKQTKCHSCHPYMIKPCKNFCRSHGPLSGIDVKTYRHSLKALISFQHLDFHWPSLYKHKTCNVPQLSLLSKYTGWTHKYQKHNSRRDAHTLSRCSIKSVTQTSTNSKLYSLVYHTSYDKILQYCAVSE